MSKRINDFRKALKRYLVYFVIMAVGIFLYFFAVLPVGKFGSTITSLLTNEYLNNLLIAVGTGIIGSALTAFLIDWRNEKREQERKYKIKSIMLSNLIKDIRLLTAFSYDSTLLAQKEDGFLDELVDEIKQVKNISSYYLDVKEYNALSEIEDIVVGMRKRFTANYNKYIIRYESYIQIYPEYKKSANREEHIKIIEEQLGLDKEEAKNMYSNIELYYLNKKVIQIALSRFESLDTNPLFWLLD